TDINDERANALNEALGNQTDEPDAVAQAFIKQLENNLPRVALGHAERFFAKLNALVPSVVDNALAKKLPTIKRYAFQKTQSQDKQTSAQNDTRLGNKLV
ncbi:MAG: short chain dehydrogenase, partial [Pseudomonadota bacterium]|nr:short chain dehydrogenase [Pseudomonadota bacterium]